MSSTRVCRYCGNEFELTRKDKLSCSRACSKAYATRNNSWPSKYRPKSNDSGVYVVRSRLAYKIGVARHIDIRMKKMANDNPFGLELLLYRKIPDAYEEESYLHTRFREYKLSGEWFNLPEDSVDEVLTYLRSIEVPPGSSAPS